MARSLFCLLMWLASPSLALALSFERYHSQDEIHSSLLHWADQHPGLVHFHTLGYSDQGRPIDLVSLSADDRSGRPAMYVNGTHHGDEKASTESALGIIDYLVMRRQDPVVRDLLENYVIYVQPIVNPDGHAANTRFDMSGIDPNRDYAYPGRSEFDSFKTHITRLVRSLMSRVTFRAAVALHSGMEGVLWAWAHSAQSPPEADVYFTLARLTAKAMGLRHYSQSYADYPANGEFIDYAYMTHGTLAVTIEVSEAATPPDPELSNVVRRAIAGAMTYMLAIADLDRGSLTVTRNSPTTQAIIPLARTANQSRRRSR